MLVLTRKHQEKIRIGDDIIITVLRTKGKAVSLGIEAPTTVPIVRGELAFESEPTANAMGAGSELAESTAAPVDSPKQLKRIPSIHVESTWTAESPSHASHGVRTNDPQVSFRRIPREKLADMLPRLSSDAGPLRSMLDQRSTT